MADHGSPLKCPSGIDGLDSITAGGLPRGRTTLVYGGAGCGKTLFALQFLVRGAVEFDEPGVFVSFEETLPELLADASALNADLPALIDGRRLYVDSIDLQTAPQQESGEFSLDALFLRIAAGIDAVGARRIAIDCIENLFARFTRQDIIRSELHRLHRWLKARAVTAIVTGEAGHHSLTRHGIEEYLSDSVIHLDHRVTNQVATRRMRVVKLRGSGHGTNEYPYIIGQQGISVLPITTLSLDYDVSNLRVSTGVDRLDTMLGGGYYRGSTVLVSGTAGTGKSSLAACFVSAACQRNERALYLAFEESPSQIVRNMRSIGMDLGTFVDGGLLRFHATRASSHGIEFHLADIMGVVDTFRPQVAVVDPISNLTTVGSDHDVKMALTRLIDFLKHHGVTVLFTDLSRQTATATTEVEISSLIDTWIQLRNIEVAGERNRGLYVLKSRGMAHSNQVRELTISNSGLDLLDVYVGAGEVVTGSARIVLEARERAETDLRERRLSQLRRAIEERRGEFEQQLGSLRQRFETDIEKLEDAILETEVSAKEGASLGHLLAGSRWMDKR